jgi:hypothetical protein
MSLHAGPRWDRGVGLRLDAFGGLVAISRRGGQGRVFRPERVPPELGAGPVVVKLYRRATPPAAADVLATMVDWRESLPSAEKARLQRVAAWPLSVVSADRQAVGVVMQDVTRRYSVPFVMPSGRRENVLLALEHLLGSDTYLQARGLDVHLDTVTRAQVAERVSAALAFLHRHAIVASDIAPSNLLVSFGAAAVSVCLIDCDSMVFRGRQALSSVQTGDWDIPAAFGEPPRTRASDAYKLGLVVLRLFARSHDGRSVVPHLRSVPDELRDLLYRALGPDAANRPPAGEWQRSISGLLARGGLNERYPGPVARAAAQIRPSAAPGHSGRPPAPPAAAAATQPALPARSPAPARPSRAPGLRLAVMLLWVVAVAVVVGLLMSRLLAATVPTQGGLDGFGSGAGVFRQAPFYHYYPPPAGSGQGAPFQ